MLQKKQQRTNRPVKLASSYHWKELMPRSSERECQRASHNKTVITFKFQREFQMHQSMFHRIRILRSFPIRIKKKRILSMSLPSAAKEVRRRLRSVMEPNRVVRKLRSSLVSHFIIVEKMRSNLIWRFITPDRMMKWNQIWPFIIVD